MKAPSWYRAKTFSSSISLLITFPIIIPSGKTGDLPSVSITSPLFTLINLGISNNCTYLGSFPSHFIVPKYLQSYDEEKQYELSVKMKAKHIKNIFKKAGLNLDELFDIVLLVFSMILLDSRLM